MKNRYCSCFSHIYVACTILGAVLLFLAPGFSRFFQMVGANAVMPALGIGLSTNISSLVETIVIYWPVVFILALMGAYIMAINEKYLPMLIVSAVDILAVIVFSIAAFSQGNTSVFLFCILDIVVSLVLTFLFFVYFREG